MLEQLRETAGVGGPAASLANEMLVIRDQYEQGQLSVEEYQFLMNEIADVRAQQELATDEQAARFIVSTAKALSMFI